MSEVRLRRFDSGGGFFSAGVSNLGNSAGTTGTVSRELVLVGGSNVSLSQSINVQSATITINASFSQSSEPRVISLNGTSGSLSLSGASNITVSALNGSTITIYGPANILNSFSVGGNTGTTGSSAISGGGFVIAGGSNVTLSQSNATISIHAASQSTVPSLSAGVSTDGNTAGTTGTVSGQIVFVAPNIASPQAGSLTLSQSINGQFATISLIPRLMLIGMSTLGNTSGTTGRVNNSYLFVGGNNITLSQSIVGNAATLTISAFNQTEEPRVVSINGTSGSLSLSGASNITVSALNGSTITIYGPANILNSLSISGNTGTTGSSEITGGGFVLAGGSNITLSQSNNSISIHGLASQSDQPRVISLNGTSGELSLSGASNITVSALNGSTITIYGPANILNSFSIGGNTGTTGSSNITGGGFVLAGGSNVTLSQSNNSISIHINALSLSALNIAAGTQTSPPSGAANEVIFSNSNNVSFGMSNVGIGIPFITASASFNQSAEPRVVSLNGTSGELSLSGASNITVSALNGSTITIYGPANILNSLSISGNTGTTGSSNITGGGFVLAGGSNITLSQSNNSISIHGTGGIAVANSQTTFVSSTVNLLEGGGAITIASGAQSLKFSVPAQSSLAAVGNVSIATAGSTVSISGMGVASLGVVGSETTYTSGNVIFSGQTNITLATSVNGGSQYIQIAAPTNILNSFSVGGNTGTTGSSAITGGGFVLAGGSNVTLSQSNNSISIHAQSQSAEPRVISLNGTSGELSLSGASNITVSALNGSTITIYGPANILNSFSIGGNTGTTGSSNITGGGFVLAGGSNITLSQSNNSISIHASQTSNIINAVSILTAGNTRGTMGVISSGTLYLAGGNAITLSQDANSITISGRVGFSLGMSDSGNTAGTSGTVSREYAFVGSNNITLSQSITSGSATLTILGPANILNSFSIGGNTGTTGSSAISGGGFVLAGGDNITLSQSNNSISIYGLSSQSDQPRVISLNGTSGSLSLSGASNITVSALNGSTITIYGPANILNSFSIGGNTGTTGSSAVSGGGFVLAGGSNITLSQSNASISIHAPAVSSLVQSGIVSISTSGSTITISGIERTISLYPADMGDITQQNFSINTLYIRRMYFPAHINATQLDMMGLLSRNSNSSGGFSLSVGLYTINGVSANLITGSSTTGGTSFTSGSAVNSSGQYGGQSGTRWRTMALNTWAITPGEYLIGLVADTANGVTLSFYAPHGPDAVRILGANNYTKYFADGMEYSVSTTDLPTTIELSEIVRSEPDTRYMMMFIGT